MKYIQGLGVVMLLIGASAFDSESLIVPAVLTLSGLAFIVWGLRDEKINTHDYTSHDASYPYYLHKR